MVKKTFTSPLFLVCCLLFVLHQMVQLVFSIRIPLADDYLDNLLAMPIILTLLLAERRWLFRKGSSYRLPLIDVILATLYISIISEFLFPLLSDRFTFDWVDFLFFFAGALLFWLFGQNENLQVSTPHSE